MLDTSIGDPATHGFAQNTGGENLMVKYRMYMLLLVILNTNQLWNYVK